MYKLKNSNSLKSGLNRFQAITLVLICVYSSKAVNASKVAVIAVLTAV